MVYGLALAHGFLGILFLWSILGIYVCLETDNAVGSIVYLGGTIVCIFSVLRLVGLC